MHGILGFVIDGGGDRYGRAIHHETALVSRLAAGCRIEYRLVEDNAAPLVDAQDLGVAGFEIGVIAKEEESHQAGSLSKTVGTPLARSSSQSGTGRPFSRRNSGLKSFD